MIPLKSGRYLVQSVPGEMSLDQLSVLEQAEKSRGLVTEEVLSINLKWEKQRSALILGNSQRHISVLSKLQHFVIQITWLVLANYGWTVRALMDTMSTGLPAYLLPH